MSEEYDDIDVMAIRQRVEQEFDRRIGFRVHFSIYFLINVIIWAGWVIVGGMNPGTDFASFPWPLVITMNWGAGLVGHALDVYYNTGERARAKREAYEEEMARRHGPEWRATASRRERRQARKDAEKPYNERQAFVTHGAVYMMVNAFFWLLWLWLRAAEGVEFPFPIFISLGWGIGLVVHGFNTYFGRRMQQAQQAAVARELERERLRTGVKAKRKPKHDDRYIQTEDGEWLEVINEDEYEQDHG